MLGTISSSIVVIILSNEKKTGGFYIFNYISYRVILVQLIDTASNVNHAISITVCWIYYYNYKRSLPLIKESLYIICYLSKDEKGIYY